AWTDPELDELCGGFFSTTRRSLEQAYVRPGTAWFATVQPVVGAWIRAFLRDGARDAGDLLAELDVLVADHRSRA
ncbi:MAG: carbohydrate ABC transporter substrate-binding protein, partial [Jiangellaceae bacterium]